MPGMSRLSWFDVTHYPFCTWFTFQIRFSILSVHHYNALFWQKHYIHFYSFIYYYYFLGICFLSNPEYHCNYYSTFFIGWVKQFWLISLFNVLSFIRHLTNWWKTILDGPKLTVSSLQRFHADMSQLFVFFYIYIVFNLYRKMKISG